jgi:hypothetical protein
VLVVLLEGHQPYVTKEGELHIAISNRRVRIHGIPPEGFFRSDMDGRDLSLRFVVHSRSVCRSVTCERRSRLFLQSACNMEFKRIIRPLLRLSPRKILSFCSLTASTGIEPLRCTSSPKCSVGCLENIWHLALGSLKRGICLVHNSPRRERTRFD